MSDYSIRSEVVFKSVPNFPAYRVGSDGSVWSCHRGRPPYGVTETWKKLKPFKNNSSGHLGIQLCCEGATTFRLVHRLVLEAFVGPCPDGMECLHDDGDPSNNSLSNLGWGTHKKNVNDSIRHRTWAHGESHGGAKLAEADVREMFRFRSLGWPIKNIGVRFGISFGTAKRIFAGKAWKHLGLVARK